MPIHFNDSPGGRTILEETLDTASQTDTVVFRAGPLESFSLSLDGDWVGLMVYQLSYDEGDTWKDVWSTEENAERIIDNPEAGVVHRVDARILTSGDAIIRMGQS